MFSYRADIAECMVRNEIKEWFIKLANETCGPDVQIRYRSNETHFNTHTYVEISGTRDQINQALEFIRNTSEILTYKMPWLNENTYSVYSDMRRDMAEKQMEKIKNSVRDLNCMISWINMFGLAYMIFNFRPDLDEKIKMELEKIFKSVAEPSLLFISYPMVADSTSLEDEPSVEKGTKILTSFHGEFLYYLSEEDILSLEIANGGDSDECYDSDLNHDIQHYLREQFPVLYDADAKVDDYNLKGYKNNKVLRYFIHKYHDRFEKMYIPNILTALEIQSLSQRYGIEFIHQDINHIDFRSQTEYDTIDFCAIYHFDPNNGFFLNYGTKYATNNYSFSFNTDNSLEPLSFNNEYSSFVIKSFSNDSPQKLNSVIKCLATNFRACKTSSEMVLYEFDLNVVSSEILSSLLTLERVGWLLFDTMIFNILTMITTLEQSNRIVFKNCQVVNIEEGRTISNDSKIRNLRFYDMNIHVNVLFILKNIEFFLIKNTRIFDTNWAVPTVFEKSDHFKFNHTRFNISTLLRLLHGLQCVQELTFMSCDLTPCDTVAMKPFSTQNVMSFINMVFKLSTLFQLFGSCEIQNRIKFENCHFPFEKDECLKFSLRPVNVEFSYTKFDSTAFYTILGTLHHASQIWINDSSITTMDEYADVPTKLIRLDSIQLTRCQLQTNLLCNVLGEMSSKTRVLFDNCELLRSSVCDRTSTLTNLSKIAFQNMKLSSIDLFEILRVIKTNAFIVLRKCQIIPESETQSELVLQSKIKVQFSSMVVESQISRLLLQTDAVVYFNNCYLKFMVDEYSFVSIRSDITFLNMRFESSAQLKSLSNISSESTLHFINCHFSFTNFVVPSFVIKPLSIVFERTSFDLEVLVTIMQKISECTVVVLDQCDIQPAQVFTMQAIKIREIGFKNMHLEIDTILRICKNFTSISHIRFINCTILCSNPDTLPEVRLTLENVIFNNMAIDVDLFQIFIQKCTNGITVLVDNANIVPVHKVVPSNEPLDVQRLVFVNVEYSPSLLKLFQYLNGQFIVEYHGQLSNHDIIEICKNTPVHGERLRLVTQNCTKLFYFKLFAEYFCTNGLNLEFDTEVEYDLPTHLIPNINSAACDGQYWSAFKVKLVSVNNATVKLDFLKDGIPIDLFYELNDLPDDSGECVIVNN